MNTVYKTLAATALTLGLTHVAFAGETEKKYVYKGDDSAKTICLSIANDEVNRLKRSLNSQKLSRIDNRVHERYTCNGEDLKTFAESMGSDKTEAYLAKKFPQDNSMEVVSIPNQ